jgi:uncharacterized membrane protein
MSQESTEPTQSRTKNLGRHALAALVLLICAVVLFHLLFGVVVFILTVAAVVLAIAGVLWAIHVFL